MPADDLNASYQKGRHDGVNQAARDVATALRWHMDGGRGDTYLTEAQAREIFAESFGVMASDDEFGERTARAV
jgi:hypothetical protein